MAPEALPPFRRISSRSISLEDGSKLLDKYLATSQRHPHLHPDALITPSGVTFSSHGGPMGGVVMHNLRRVAAGLRGEYLEPEPEPDFEEEADGVSNGSKKGSKGTNDADTADAAQNDWQDMSEYEREEAQLAIGEVGDRTNVVQDGVGAPEAMMIDGEQDSEKKRKTNDGEATLDKAARRKAKKMKMQAAKVQKEKAREEKSQKEK